MKIIDKFDQEFQQVNCEHQTNHVDCFMEKIWLAMEDYDWRINILNELNIFFHGKSKISYSNFFWDKIPLLLHFIQQSKTIQSQ